MVEASFVKVTMVTSSKIFYRHLSSDFKFFFEKCILRNTLINVPKMTAHGLSQERHLSWRIIRSDLGEDWLGKYNPAGGARPLQRESQVCGSRGDPQSPASGEKEVTTQGVTFIPIVTKKK